MAEAGETAETLAELTRIKRCGRIGDLQPLSQRVGCWRCRLDPGPPPLLVAEPTCRDPTVSICFVQVRFTDAHL